MNFYSGYKFEDILLLDTITYNIMGESMKRLKALKRLEDMDNYSYPMIKDISEKKKKHRNLYKIAFPESFEKKAVRNEDLRLA